MSDPAKASGKSHLIKILVFLGLIGLVAFVYIRHGDALTLENLAKQEAALNDFKAAHPIAIYGLAFLVYVAVTGLSLPGAAPLTLIYGWFLGFIPALVVVSFASTAGATIAFLVSRHLLRDTVQSKFGERLAKFNAALEKEGAFYLFTLRLIPAVPFFVINLVMGLTPMRVLTYWWVSQVGMLPGTAAYVYAGSAVPNLDTLAEKGLKGILSPQLLIAFVILGLLPLALKKITGWLRRDRPSVA